MEFDNTPAAAASFGNRWADVRVALTVGGTDPTTIADESEVDGVALATGDRFVCTGSRTDAGIYTVGALSSARSVDADTAGKFTAGRAVRVREGDTVANRGNWAHTTLGAITLGVTTLVITRSGAASVDLGFAAYDNTPAGVVDL
jgi:hypothetical protein